MRVLLLEDDVDLRSLIVIRLQREGFAADEAGRISEADHVLDMYDHGSLVFARVVPDGDALDDVHELRTRRTAKLGDPPLIRTVRGGGYALDGDAGT